MASFYEFFAGGGMVRAALAPKWRCLFANDVDVKKASSYEANWGKTGLKVEDVAKLSTGDLPGAAELAWASFPCQDLSLAGAGAGLLGTRSGTFWPFWRLLTELAKEGRPPRLVVLENVCGALTSHGGKDFAAIGAALVDSGYRFGAVVIDAIRFVPQSRPRLFIIACNTEVPIPPDLTSAWADGQWHTNGLVRAYNNLHPETKHEWVWWRLPVPRARTSVFGDLIDECPQGVAWHSEPETKRLLQMMSELNRRKVEEAKRAQCRMVGAVYRRTRADGEGQRVQRAEIRFDDVAGCLRTPAGGSSRQAIMIVDGQRIRSRLLSPREAARLMGLKETYVLPTNYNEAYHLVGDGVVVPVVKFLATELLEPLLASAVHKQAA